MATEGAWYDAEEAAQLKQVDGVLGFDDVLSQLYAKISGAPERVSAPTALGQDPTTPGTMAMRKRSSPPLRRQVRSIRPRWFARRFAPRLPRSVTFALRRGGPS